MKLCQNCGQLLAEEVTSCPTCGSEVREGRKHIDDYRIVDVLHEGYSSILCRAIKDGSDEFVVIRIFTQQSGVNERIAERLKQELEELKKLPEDYFVRHFEIRQSSDGLWYRVSEWVDAENWGSLLASGRLDDYRVAFKLFARIASILEGLHRIGHFIPHLILDDIIVFIGEEDELEVKIDYKLSRFLDPELDRPGPMLRKLLNRHPDITNQCPLDFRSDIWSLGKIFIELLTADYEIVDFKAKIESLALPHEVKVLLKIMLADDPGLRPQSMAEVANTFSKVQEREIEVAMDRRRSSLQVPAREIKGLKRWVRLLLIAVLILGAMGYFTWHYLASEKIDNQAILSDYANRYAGSVAFVMVEYWVRDDLNIYYRNRTEGTAFLVDREGYLLTNRHVACPWLEDNKLNMVINRFKELQRPLRLEYRAFLWFEGRRAFKRLPDFSKSGDLEDIYFLDAAYSTEGPRRLTIAGVGKAPIKTWQQIKSPLREDFAVIKLDHVPPEMRPLPLDLKMDPLKIPKLLPVIALGIPLGSRTQEATVNVRVTTGHDRRAFENFLQVDTSLYRGNSGGPVIDIHGNVIGIASSVAVDWAASPVPVVTPLSDLGMVLPITGAAAFLQEIKAGRVKWNGVLDLNVDIKIESITRLAGRMQWEAAQTLADQELKKSLDPTLVIAAAMMHFCTGDYPGAEHLFHQALSMDAENGNARMMLFLIDWLHARSVQSPYGQDLMMLDWQSPYEFFGYLARLLEGRVDETTAIRGGYTDQEKSWLYYATGLKAAKRNELPAAERQMEEALLLADSHGWNFYLALSGLENIQQQRLAQISSITAQNAYKEKIKAFDRKMRQKQLARQDNMKQIVPLLAKLKETDLSVDEKLSLLVKVREIDKTDRKTLIALAYLNATNAKWRQALDNARSYLAQPGRENRDRLRMGLLEAEILHILGRAEDAKSSLETYKRQIETPWYRNISECLLEERSVQSLTDQAAENPQYILTAYTALGLWAEGKSEKLKAVSHYREALGSYLDDLVEYELARQRIKKLREDRD